VYRKQTIENIKCAVENNAKQFVIYKATKTETSYKEQIKAVRHYLMDNGVVFTEHEEQHYKYGLAHVFNLKKKE
jgi:hypothetical protein